MDPAASIPGSSDQTLTRTRRCRRAPIVDKDGKPLASTGPGRIVGLEPQAIQDLNLVKAALQQQLASTGWRSTGRWGHPAWSPTTSFPSSP